MIKQIRKLNHNTQITVKYDLRSCELFLFKIDFFNKSDEDKMIDVLYAIKSHFCFDDFCGVILCDEWPSIQENIINDIFESLKFEKDIPNMKLSMMAYLPIEDKAIKFEIEKGKDCMVYSETEEDDNLIDQIEMAKSLFIDKKEIIELDLIVLSKVIEKCFRTNLSSKLSFF